MSTNKPLNINQQGLYIFILIIQFIILISIAIPVINPMVFLVLIFILFSMVLRLRFQLKAAYMLIDIAIIALISILYPNAIFYLYIYAYYFAYKNRLIYTIPLIFIGFLLNYGLYYILLIQAIMFGALLYLLAKENASNKEQEDNLRRHIYELELDRVHLLSDYQDTERISRLSERQRIAEILHDSLGHELTAAHLSLKAYKTLLENNKTEHASKALDKVEDKLVYSLEQLKSSVKNIEPRFETGLNDLKYLINNFAYPIDFNHSGNHLRLKPYIWQLILMSVKEALTNISKHARPKNITIDLTVTDYILKLVIENDGVINYDYNDTGNGLRYMRSRLEAINGSLSIQKEDKFRLIIIIPYEAVN